MTTRAERLEIKRQHFLEMKAFDAQHRAEGAYIAGVDEVGRGPLAGPVVTAAVVLPEDFDEFEVDDSKKLTDKKRRELDVKIREKALAYGFGLRDNRRIDEINILNATKEAMADAVFQAARMLRERLGMEEHESSLFAPLSLVMIDAVHLLELEAAGVHQISPTKGDSTSASIAAASIIAKVKRDDMMIAYDAQYPGYAFEKNKGYGTRAHYEGLRANGLTPIHRRSFLKNFL